MRPSLRSCAAALAVLALAACSEGSPTAARVRQPVSPGGTVIAELECTITVATQSMRCGQRRAGGARGDIIAGSSYIQLSSRNVAYNAGTGQFTFEVAMTNHVRQKIGTADGSTVAPTGIRSFFFSGPTVTGGTGSISVVPDGFALFTATGQAFYEYDEIVSDNQQSSWHTWTFVMPPTVTSFSFTIQVSAPVQFPSGWVEISPASVDTYTGFLELVSATVYSQVGVAQPDSVVWSSDDPSVAAIWIPGLLSAQSAGTTTIHAISAVVPARTGSAPVVVH
jgi:hypothetical protein